ncbi:DNA-binding protein [Pedobacter yulinensis]|uniref:DNA-binding protein n=1 Tax=Pedobacter yulinensis TaxID=2126353 RepID=A0A2T3HKY3_9SPHI|nr:helix-turn-helix domain-containing protein [Pedobacter yulinensis]PST83086.1 DNA-binding protein [Pedobacter yulinensis]
MTAIKDNQQQKPTIQRDQLITLGDLIEFKEALLKDIAGLMQQRVAEPAKRWLKSDEVRKMLRLSAGKLQYLRDKGIIPFTKLGGITYYDYQEIMQLMESGHYETHLRVA